MEKQRRKFGASGYSGNAAVYQPDQVQLRRTIGLVLLLLTVFLIGLATRAHADERADWAGPLRQSSADSGSRDMRE